MSRTRLVATGASSLALAGGAVGVGCALSGPTPVKSSLRKLIGDTKRNLLGDGPDFWDIKYSTYARTLKETKPLKLSSEDGEGLRKWCQATITEEVEVAKKDGSNYSIALQLCTRPTRTEKLLKNNRTLVEHGFWKAKAQSYNRKRDKYIIPTIGDNNKATPEQIEKWCNENVEGETENSDFTYELTEKWCAYG